MVIKYRDMNLEQLYDKLDQLDLEEAEKDSPAYRKILNLVLRQQVQTAMRSAEAAERSARAAKRASLAALGTALAALLTLLARFLGWL